MTAFLKGRVNNKRFYIKPVRNKKYCVLGVAFSLRNRLRNRKHAVFMVPIRSP